MRPCYKSVGFSFSLYFFLFLEKDIPPTIWLDTDTQSRGGSAKAKAAIDS